MARDAQGIRSRRQAGRAPVQSTHRALLPSLPARTRNGDTAFCPSFTHAGARRRRNRGSRHSACARARLIAALLLATGTAQAEGELYPGGQKPIQPWQGGKSDEIDEINLNVE